MASAAISSSGHHFRGPDRRVLRVSDPEEYLAGSIRDVEIRKRRIALEDVGAVGDLAL